MLQYRLINDEYKIYRIYRQCQEIIICQSWSQNVITLKIHILMTLVIIPTTKLLSTSHNIHIDLKQISSNNTNFNISTILYHTPYTIVMQI